MDARILPLWICRAAYPSLSFRHCLDDAATQELFFEILERNHMMEDEARPIFQQLCEAVAYLHGLGIVHRCVSSVV